MTPPTQIRNLKKLSAYLKTLPADYARFEMASFLGNDAVSTSKIYDSGVRSYLTKNGGLPGCGTVACAVGHGPAAHIFMRKSELGSYTPDWTAYACRAFGTEDGSPEFDWMFGAYWADCDNTALGASKRIDYFLTHGIPDDFDGGDEDSYGLFVEEYS